MKQATKRGIGIPEFPEIPLESVIPNCPSDALNFIGDCLRWDPTKRINSAQMVIHPYLSIESHELKHHEMGFKKIHSMGDKTNYKIEVEDRMK